MDLHAWITQQVDRVEASARSGQRACGTWEYDSFVHEIRDKCNAGTAATVYEDAPGEFIALNDPDSVLRRCEADRRILARHRVDPAAANTTHAAACDGCGVEWVQDYCDPIVDNLNDCPELLDLAHAHGITPDILAGLDRPRPPEPKPHAGPRLGLANILAPPITTADVPAALRGPNWKH